jgi:imidazolonepropionase-like amidohydrolase
MTFAVSVAFAWPKIIEIEEKYNKKMQVFPYILAGWLLDGAAGRIRERVILETENHRIVRIRRAVEKDLARKDLLSLSDCTLLPGLVDCHVHLTLSGSDDQSVRERQLSVSFGDAKQMIRRHLALNLHHGVTAVRDGGDYGGHALRYKRRGLNEEDEAPEMKAAGKAWHAPGRYGRLVGRTPYKNRSLDQSVLKGQMQADHVKIVNSGLNSLVDFGKETFPQFKLEDLEKAVSRAHQKGLKAMVHANGRQPVKEAIESGCDSIEHGFFMGTENLKRLADKQIIWVPTAFTMEAYARTLPKSSRASEVARKNLDHQLEQIRQARELGVRIAVGTDAGSPGVHHGAAVAEEMRLFHKAGLDLGQAVQCACSTGAALLGLEDRAGCLMPGSPATFVAVRAEPEKLLETLESPERVWFKGIPMMGSSSGWESEG